MSDVTTQIDVRDGQMTVVRSQDCTAIAEHTKALHNAGAFGSSEMRHAASIPNVFVEKYCNDNGISFREFMGNSAHIRRMLQDPALEHFRIWKGRI